MANNNFTPKSPMIEMGTDKRGNKVRKSLWYDKNGKKRVRVVESLHYLNVRKDHPDNWGVQGYRVAGRIMVTYTIFPLIDKNGGLYGDIDITHHFGAKSGQTEAVELCRVKTYCPKTASAGNYLAYRYPNGNIYCPEIKTTFNVSKCMIAVSK